MSAFKNKAKGKAQQTIGEVQEEVSKNLKDFTKKMKK